MDIKDMKFNFGMFGIYKKDGMEDLFCKSCGVEVPPHIIESMGTCNIPWGDISVLQYIANNIRFVSVLSGKKSYMAPLSYDRYLDLYAYIMCNIFSPFLYMKYGMNEFISIKQYFEKATNTILDYHKRVENMIDSREMYIIGIYLNCKDFSEIVKYFNKKYFDPRYFIEEN